MLVSTCLYLVNDYNASHIANCLHQLPFSLPKDLVCPYGLDIMSLLSYFRYEEIHTVAIIFGLIFFNIVKEARIYIINC